MEGRGLFARKPMEVTKRTGYKPTLGLLDLSNIGIAAIIGAGIFVFLGNEAIGTGPAVIIALALGGVAAILAAFSYAEAAAMLPGNGSAYAFSYAAFGSFPAFMVGWLFFNAYAIGNSGVAIGWSGFFNVAVAGLGVAVPDALSKAPQDGGFMNLPAFLFMVAVTFVATLGLNESKRINNVLVALKLGIVLFVIVVGAFLVEPANWKPFSPAGWRGVAGSTAVLFFAYLGFDTIAATGAEAKNPRRHMPLAILLSIIVCAILYMFMAGVVTGVAPHGALDSGAPVASAFSLAGAPWAAGIITAGALIGLATVAYAFHIAMARILQNMAADGFAPAILGRVSAKNGAPIPAAIAVGVVSSLAAAFIDLGNTIDMAVDASIVIYMAVSLGAIVTRFTRGKPSGFHVPVLVHFASIAALLAVITFGIAAYIHYVLLMWMGLGMVLYGLWAHKSALRVQANNDS